MVCVLWNEDFWNDEDYYEVFFKIDGNNTTYCIPMSEVTKVIDEDVVPNKNNDLVTMWPWYKNTIRETSNYIAANIRHGIVIQNKHTFKNVFLYGDDEIIMGHDDLKQLENHNDKMFDRYCSGYDTVMESSSNLKNHAGTFYTKEELSNIWKKYKKSESSDAQLTSLGQNLNQGMREEYAVQMATYPDEPIQEDVVPFKKPEKLFTCRDCGVVANEEGVKNHFAKPDICSRCYVRLKEADDRLVPFGNNKPEELEFGLSPVKLTQDMIKKGYSDRTRIYC